MATNERQQGTSQEKNHGATIDSYLSNQKFLSFLEKNTDADANIEDDEYVSEKIAVFEALNSAKSVLKEFVTLESGSVYKDAVSEEFIDKLEGLAAVKPDEFLEFSNQVHTYIESVRTLEKLGIKNERELRQYEETTQEARELEKNRSLASKIPFFTARKLYMQRSAELASDARELAVSTREDEATLGSLRAEIQSLRAELNDNEGFKLLEVAFIEKVRFKIWEAMQAGDHSTLVKEKAALESRYNEDNLFTEDRYDEVLLNYRLHADSVLQAGTEGLVEKKESNSFNSFQKGVFEMQQKGIELGLSEDECNDRIRVALEKKIAELQKSSTDPQAKIKILLAKRVIKGLIS